MIVSLPGVLAFLRFLYLFAIGQGAGHVQSLGVGSALIAAGFVLFIGGLLADLIAANRVLLAEIRSRQLIAELEEDARE
ncbi:MAG: hypothetical protein AAGD47_01585 [Pseudomonadota bacterium]